MNYFESVKTFMQEVGQPTPATPTIPSVEQHKLRFNMLCSEFAEVICAMYGISPTDVICKGMKYHLKTTLYEFVSEQWFTQDVSLDRRTNLAQQIVDLHYVLSGLSVDFGLPEPEVFEEVHSANMRKIGGPKRADGKQLPPSDWEPPDIASVLKAYIAWSDRH